jgi:hypothetical protein
MDLVCVVLDVIVFCAGRFGVYPWVDACMIVCEALWR